MLNQVSVSAENDQSISAVVLLYLHYQASCCIEGFAKLSADDTTVVGIQLKPQNYNMRRDM